MKSNGGWFRNFTSRMGASIRRFMAGRYGTDRLNMTLLSVALVLVLVYSFVGNSTVKLILWILSYALMFWAIFRSLSRSTYKRYEENRRFLQFFDQIKDRQHRYYNCPKCRQRVRVPRGKGKIAITCPKCREKFVKKT